MLISPAFAQSGGIVEGGFGLLPIILVMVIFYFLLIRPQEHFDQLNCLLVPHLSTRF